MKKISQYNINPARGTRWSVEKHSKVFVFTIIGTISTGFGPSYRILEYELKYDHRNDPQIMPAEKLLDLIDNRVILPHFNPDGSLIAKEYN